MRKLFAILVVALMLASMAPLAIAEENGSDDEAKMCAADVKECPDGSFVPRDPEDDCEFKPCPGEDSSDEDDAAEEDRGRRIPPQPSQVARQRMAERAKEVLRERFGDLTEEQEEKLGKLRPEHARKLHVLREKAAGHVAELDEDEIGKLAALGRARMKELADEDPEVIREKLRSLKVERVKAAKAFQKRQLPPQAAERARERFEEARERYEEEKESFREEREEWREAVREGDDEAAMEHGRNYLLHAADMVIETAEKVRARVQGNDDLTDDEVAEIVADLNATIEDMEAAKDDVNAADTKEELKAAAADIQEAWERRGHLVRLRAQQVMRTQVGEILSRSRALENRLESILAEMDARNVSVENLDHLLDKFSDKVEGARERYEESEDLFDQAKEERDKDALHRSRELSREAHHKLKEAHRILMDIVRKVKQEGFEVEDDDEYVEVVREEDDDDEDETEIEVEVEDGRSWVEVEVGEDEYEFVLNTTDVDVVYAEIANRTGLSLEVVEDVAEIEVDDDSEDAENGSDEESEDAIGDNESAAGNATNTTA